MDLVEIFTDPQIMATALAALNRTQKPAPASVVAAAVVANDQPAPGAKPSAPSRLGRVLIEIGRAHV